MRTLGAIALICWSLPIEAAEEGKFFIHADVLSRDEERGITKGIGDVEVAYGDNVLTADEITLIENENKVIAVGNVRLLDKSGSATYGRQAVLYDEGSRFKVDSPRVALPEGSRAAARVLEKRSDNQYVLHHGVFTPCAPCADEAASADGKKKMRRPIWQIRATRIVNDRKNQNLHYYNAVFEVLGAPVFYLPYHSHPDPTVKRRSGWLNPSFGHDKNLGDMYFLHYFGAISPHMNFDFMPFHTNRDGWVLRASSKIRVKSGEIALEGAGAKSHVRKENQLEGKEQMRTYGALRAKFDIDRNWRWGTEYSRASDDTFLRRYGIYGARTTRSNLFLEGFTPRNYARAEFLSYQDFRSGSQKATRLSPSLQYNLVTKPLYRLGGWDVKLDFTRFRNEETVKPSVTRFVGKAVKKYLSASKSGLVFGFEQNLQANLYHIDPRKRASAKVKHESRFASETTIRFLTTVSYPLASVRRWGYFGLTPKVGVALGPNHKPKSAIPNIDSNEVEFDESDLFITDRATGYDRSESGKRVDYGLGLSASLNNGGGGEGFFGQSYRIDEDSLFPKLGGAGKGYSDYVGNFRIFPSANFSLNYRFRLARKDLDLRVSEMSTAIGGGKLNLNASYLKVKLPYEYNNAIRSKRREEISYRTNFRVSEHWGGHFGGTYNLENNRSVGYATRFGYSDNCFAAEVLIDRRYVRDRDYSASNTIIFRFAFKYVGPLQFK